MDVKKRLAEAGALLQQARELLMEVFDDVDEETGDALVGFEDEIEDVEDRLGTVAAGIQEEKV